MITAPLVITTLTVARIRKPYCSRPIKVLETNRRAVCGEEQGLCRILTMPVRAIVKELGNELTLDRDRERCVLAYVLFARVHVYTHTST